MGGCKEDHHAKQEILIINSTPCHLTVIVYMWGKIKKGIIGKLGCGGAVVEEDFPG